LELSVTSDEARFSQSWTLYAADQWIPLPGDRERWPEAVTADGERIPVVMRKTGPAVRLPPGMHELAGRIAWVERPRALAVPPQTGLLRLTVDGRRIVHPDRARNTVWLGEREAPARAADAIDVKVYRLLSDDVPTRLYTRFTMEVSGSLREEHLRPALPEGFIPAALESELPARLEPGGDLRLQVRPGVWQVELEARAGQVLNEIAAPKPEENLPDSEIWSYRSADRLRVTVPEGPAPVDPLQVSVPEAYLTLPAFRVEPGDTLTIVERSRGRTAGDNALHLQRLLWLDFDGGGYTFSDKLEGRLQSWRLDMAAPYALQNATEDERNLLITAGPEVGWTGVELRQPEIDLRAYGRADTRDAMPASGWQTRLDGLTVELNLPPGQKLLAAPGADRAPGAWAERWKLLDFFLVLIITLATARMFGRPAGAVALAALVLSWHESGAAQWAWLNALVAFALVRVAPAGRLRGAALLYRGASLLGLLLLVIPFFAEEVRLGIYPQLEPQRGPSAVRALVTPPQPEAPAAAGAARNVARPRAVQPEPLEEIAVTGVRQGFQSYARYAPNAIVQAGPGRPSWSWNTYDLYWSGPVGPERTLDLLILPRWLVSLLRFLDVLLLAALAALFVIEALRRNWRYPRRRGDAAASPLAFALGLFMTGALLAPPPASAETPPPEILEQLEQRLLEPPPCAPRCAELTSAHADVGRDALTVELEVHALENVAMSLPGSLDGWRPERLVIDGAPAPHVYRRGDQTLWIRVTEGRHRVVLEGPLPPVETLEVPFPAPPRVFTANARGWALAGVHERRLSAGSLTLTRLHENGDTQPGTRWESSRFPEFVRVERLIELDLEWRVTTTVHRVAPRQGAITIEIPLLAGASLLTADLPVHDGRVRVSFAPSDNVV
ncbi:MAG TPA: hypothetical protein VE175_08905, partial [Woeseiaceae bacterium]|nr:hypothetical protein [Woeseiaceae bacterium]